ncbi:sensor histidine kinase [Paenibacillus sp. GCM10012307]|uniref:histidine kinase n=2 Tax=Paenibacillus TaxID=44249 RepID=A0A934MNC7_9BACL|nr:sensor histidine kinase [Paenibacillus roseus]MBJ6364330.1 sensor histidine kinase [Paenibacillus roseus]
MKDKFITRIAGMGFRNKLIILFTLISIVPLSVLGLLSYNHASYTVQEKVYQTMLESLSQITYSMNYFINDIEQLSMYIYSNEDVQQILSVDSADRSTSNRYQDEKRISAILESFVGFKKWDIEIYILGKNGDRFFTADVLPKQYRNINSNWGLFRKARLAGGNAVWDTQYTLKKLYDFGTALGNGRLLKNIDTGEFLGFLVIDIMETDLVDKYAKAHLVENGQIFLLDQFGNVISSLPKHQIGTKLQAEFLLTVLQGSKGYFQSENQQGEKQMIIYDTSEVSGFKLVSVVPVKEVIKESSSIRTLTIGILIVGIMTSFGFAYVVSNHITHPLRKLRLLMGQAEKGDLDISFPVKYKDEVGQLGQSFNRMIDRIQYLIKENYEKILQLREAELKAIQAQINPHFLYNTLDSINWMARIHNIDEISRTVISLGELFRYSIRKGNQFITISEDMTQIRHYLAIQKIRFRDKVTMEVEVDPNILSFYTLKLLIQPVVENAIVHGLERKVGHGTLRIRGQAAGDKIVFVIQDDGIGFSASQQEDHTIQTKMRAGGGTGIGLDNLKKRMELQFGEEASFNMTSEIGLGTTVTIKIPQIKHAGDEDVQGNDRR